VIYNIIVSQETFHPGTERMMWRGYPYWDQDRTVTPVTRVSQTLNLTVC